ncbi:MAG: trypsin-like serine protease [Myxococcota bacterium]
MTAGFLALVLSSTLPGLAAPPDPMEIVGGDAVSTCGWPTTVYTGGCTATLVHPQAISTAQHCGMPSFIQFGETAGSGPTVDVLGCVGEGSQDAMLCQLAEPVTEVPVTPVLFGCEADAYLQVGQPVAMAGFGQTSFGVGGGTKLWAPQTITAVEPGRVIVGNAGDGVSPCPGDSGGPVFVQVADDSWRVIGTVLGGTTGTPCNSAADFQRIDAVVANFEAQSGLDITPCFDGATGAWDPTPDCGGFFAGDEVGVGTWADWCSGTPRSGSSDACGAPFDDGSGSGSTSGTGTGDDDGTSGEPPATSSTSAGNEGGADTSTGTPSSEDDSTSSALPDTDSGTSGSATEAGEGGCRVDGRPAPLWLGFVMLGVALGRARRGRRFVR